MIGKTDTYSIESCSKDIEEALKDHPKKSNLPLRLLEPIPFNPVKHRENSRQPQRNEHGRPNRSESRGAEARHNGHNRTARPQRGYLASTVNIYSFHLTPYVVGTRHPHHSPVPDLQRPLAPKPVVDARYETSRNQQHDPRVVQLIPHLVHPG